MKKLTYNQSVSLNLGENPDYKKLNNDSYVLQVMEKQQALSEIYLHNRSCVITMAIEIEGTMGSLLGAFFTYTNPETEYGELVAPPHEITPSYLFEELLLESPLLSFTARRKLVDQLLKKTKLINGKNLQKLVKGLSQLEEWRNAMAHGSTFYNVETELLELSYHRGGSRKLVLTNELFERINETANLTTKLLSDAIQTVELNRGLLAAKENGETVIRYHDRERPTKLSSC
ncbi:hypothetical protein IC617_08130 [Neiella sp. HB171785]|uniref:Uncharacterized protein n=1 Tax=Neiella litorisoli TaxID=2771431 RepID=A0A8J6QQI1_9GAMM|nr:hypothetical protein [Neiella litorisoli]MBD1389391.1 hypothetical protein [Neiella litorisoli]